MSEGVYYVYTDDSNRHYYYDASTTTTSYSRPVSGMLLDPTTHEPFRFPEKHLRHHSKRKRSQPSAPNSPLDDPSPPIVDPIPPAPTGATLTVKPLRSPAAAIPAPAPFVMLPADLRAEIHQFQVSEFAHRFFRAHRKGGVFSRKTVSFEDLSQWQSTPLKAPLLKSLPPKLGKSAAQLFKYILSYTGAEPDSRPGNSLTLQRLIALVFPAEELRDELYFQLVKQTRGNSNADCLYRTWEVFLLTASVFPATRNAESYIKSHILESAESADPRIADIAQFAFFRFEARCTVGRPVTEPVTPAFIQAAVAAHRQAAAPFSAPLREQLWCQRARCPRMPVPAFVHGIERALFEKGAEEMEGVFRLPGNMRLLREVQASVHEDAGALAPLSVHDLASLFKAWFGGLPQPIVHRDLVPSLKSAAEDKAFVAFAEGLPELPRRALKYLVGFLRRFAQAARETKMDDRNLAIVFAPNIVDVSGAADPMLVAKMSENSREFLVALIAEWDVADAYPITEDLLPAA